MGRRRIEYQGREKGKEFSISSYFSINCNIFSREGGYVGRLFFIR